ncbi:DUF3099 domain-containing protein [Kitasatospora aureofaciens]|uniref:DUF3099 domain-containing protein n=1 Tax=Kitasatospora aureofaciens TaxID=1894 RepID=A0A1E7N0M2_KITAU|nr:DUF3099 domain-containing protein [Kitasatospora aureofaciens]QEU99374.1 DUF3099 domain-containing protein [Streptomyces viridifaciens]ARF78155.1 hypothetical protein B6264_03810 [Kitasatospora aureofaciens]OEV34239.1 hypothetical protein HS99_0036910 [Kitasatospora aureofaciens]UKZ05445.1 DUF3099 domain-containing protein [Streptomyces viridifaciens]GGU81380.1 hypothetical protein GCM10010502_36900 [Kitasatospora aureofaciens]
MGKSAEGGRVYRITGARSSLTEDVRGRQRRYVISMLIRTLCVLLAVALWDVQRWLAFTALAGGVLLPYFAVLVANAGREQPPSLPSTFDFPSETPLMLGPGGTGGAGAAAGTEQAKAAGTGTSPGTD